MQQVVSMRPFVPARDFALSQRFYQRLGFRITGVERDVAFVKLEGCTLIEHN